MHIIYQSNHFKILKIKRKVIIICNFEQNIKNVKISEKN